MFEVSVRAGFAAAHHLRDYAGSCERLHGHNWEVEVVLRADSLDAAGMVMDFREVKSALAELLDLWDHRNLNDLPAFQDVNPTAENLARTVYRELARRVPARATLARATVWESAACGATYTEDPRPAPPDGPATAPRSSTPRAT
ncbi:MAG: 6-carboxytetrahydropterin synthase QueD [Planctomycetes bacterium]|nr:6-carboxytetrahydropterin synthase QueD [Planctomycetota bacterium]